MTNDGVIRNGKLEYNLNGEAARVAVLLSSRFEKYESLAVKEELAPNQCRIMNSLELPLLQLKKHLKNNQKQSSSKENSKDK